MGLGKAIEGIITNSSKAIGNLQVSVNKILWGRGNSQPRQTATFNTTTGQLEYTATPVNPAPGKNKLLDSGLFSALDTIIKLDLCNILQYLLSNVNIPSKPKKDRGDKTKWTDAQKTLYAIQDAASFIVAQIDKYTAYPNTLISSFTSSGPNGLATNISTAQYNQAVQQQTETGTTNLSGFDIAKYNTFYLIQSIKDSLNATAPKEGSIFSSEDRALLAQVPGISSKLNYLDDFIASINKYTDYRNISNSDLENIRKKIALVRTICVAIQTLDLKSVVGAAANFLGADIRSQIQELSKFIDPTKLISTLKAINNTIQSFVRIVQRIQQILKTAQFIIKILILFVKIFTFIRKFLTKLPLPNLFTVVGIQSTLSSFTEDAKESIKDATKTLKEINALLQVLLDFVRYVLANTNQLAIRIQAILDKLKDCEAVKDPNGNVSPVIAQLEGTLQTLKAVQQELEAYVTAYDSRTNPDTARFGEYDIRVVDEELVDPGIPNKRRRGIAIDKNGAIVAQSDLTFATNTTVIIEEVKIKLIQLGLVQSNLGAITGEQAAIIAESLGYLSNNDVIQDDLALDNPELDSPDNEDENQGLGLQAFVNKLKGGRRLRNRTRKMMAKASAQFGAQLAGEGVSARNSIASTVQNKTVGSGQGTKNYEVKVYQPAPPGTNPALASTLKILVHTVTVQGVSVNQATEEAKDRVDEYRRHPEWTYTVKQLP